MQTATRSTKSTRSPNSAKSVTPSAAAESVPLLVYVPRRARERLNKLVRDNQMANQAEAITKLINEAYKKA